MSVSGKAKAMEIEIKNKENHTSEIIRVGLVLFAITAISALLLAVVNEFTAPVIAKNREEKQLSAMRTVLPGATELYELDFDAADGSSVTAVYKADGENGGYAVTAAPNGYGGEISLVVGIDYEGKVTGVDVISQSETPGLGANCTGEEFKSRYVGKTAGVTVVKGGIGENTVDAITSATITSKAVTRGVNDALAAVDKIR